MDSGLWSEHAGGYADNEATIVAIESESCNLSTQIDARLSGSFIFSQINLPINLHTRPGLLCLPPGVAGRQSTLSEILKNKSLYTSVGGLSRRSFERHHIFFRMPASKYVFDGIICLLQKLHQKNGKICKNATLYLGLNIISMRLKPIITIQLAISQAKLLVKVLNLQKAKK